jgi:hypothetical protein
MQLADEHVWPKRQALAHCPQLIESVVKSVHTPLQLVCPAGQHSPAAQTFPPEHAYPQAPQLLAFVVKSTQ